jgi:hypothetical protein
MLKAESLAENSFGNLIHICSAYYHLWWKTHKNFREINMYTIWAQDINDIHIPNKYH